MTAPGKLRVAVIGAGAAGLCAARHIAARPESFAPPVVFEASGRIGGTWVYTEETGQSPDGLPIHSSMYRDLRTNLPKEVMAFPDFPFDPSLPSFLHHSDVLAYLESYADHFCVREHIRFWWLVDAVSPAEGPEGGWDVTACRVQDRTVQATERFDAVIVCSGHYSDPFIPPIPGLETFPGRLLHSHEYRCPEPFAGRTVVLLGAGPSGLDLTLQLAPVAQRVILSHRQPLLSPLPGNVLQAAPAVAVAGDTVQFGDGAEHRADVLILCTGYRYHFPFLSPAHLGLQITAHMVTPLYRHLLPPHHPGLFFIGVCQQICPFPHFHCQLLFCLAVLGGTCCLPSAAEMQVAAEGELRQHLGADGAPRHFHQLGRLQWGYCQELARLGGFEPLPPVVRKIYEATQASRRQDVSSYRSLNYRVLSAEEWALVGADPGGKGAEDGQ
ncbi:flavin-containing monooxygenase FMO GS-OX4-like isoform X2 [Dermochelys coriacea]|nr:flavin-containing monooxygenase FMO GS-OX4-like isoform X2 [Dermochelys coriacea]XP_043359565.1 flavin-containing monooxygenase FMO GS-OX4-like isoform X2 [Dermochelys coriacea]XP_043359566.1 flavin-containing monooxygenase FMO GS-OX4-like isoform X2 [Dermochelys coriacea]